MARSTKNSRRITVNDVEYRWRANGDDGYITFTIWPANEIGPAILGNFQYHETWLPDGEGRCLSAGDQIVITNRILRRVIEFSISKHAYNPLEKGPVLNLRRMDYEIDMSDAVRADNVNKRIHDILALGRPGRETYRARNCIAFAVECADELGDNEFDSCHLLSGLYREGHGVAFHVLKNLAVSQEQIDDALRARVRSVANQFQINIDMKVVLDAAFAAASEMSHNYIGTEHLLIGTTSDTTQSARMLVGFGLSPKAVENEVFHLLGHRLD